MQGELAKTQEASRLSDNIIYIGYVYHNLLRCTPTSAQTQARLPCTMIKSVGDSMGIFPKVIRWMRLEKPVAIPGKFIHLRRFQAH